MEQKTMEELKGMSREDRMAYFNANKSALMERDLEVVNGGSASVRPHENPDSDCPYNRCYFTSFGWICDGVVGC